MAMMCEECKCSTYLNEETGMYSCENECPCCNDPDYESDWDQHLRIMKQVREYVYLHKLSLEQDFKEVEDKMELEEDLNGDTFNDLDVEHISLTGQIIATSHILNYLDNLSYEGV